MHDGDTSMLDPSLRKRRVSDSEFIVTVMFRGNTLL